MIAEGVRSDDRLASLLVELESSWRAQGAPISHALAPGLSRNQIQVLARNENLVLPESLYTWWGWHNGVDPDFPHWQRAETGTDFPLISLQEALTFRARLLADHGEPIDDHPGNLDKYWRPAWVPIVGNERASLFVDTSAPPGSRCPVRALNDMWEELTVIRAYLVEDVVEAWLHQLARGWMRWDSTANAWDFGSNRPLYLAHSGLV